MAQESQNEVNEEQRGREGRKEGRKKGGHTERVQEEKKNNELKKIKAHLAFIFFSERQKPTPLLHNCITHLFISPDLVIMISLWNTVRHTGTHMHSF